MIGTLRAVALCGLLFLAGCGRPASEPPPKPAAPADGVYRLSLATNPATLDPARLVDVDSDGVARRIFSTLVKLDGALQPVPDLAERWEVSHDGLTYTFHLRRGVRFHHGRELTSEDVRYSYERLLRADTLSHRAWVIEPIAGAAALRDGKADRLSGLRTPDAYTVRIRLAEPFSPFLSHLAMTNAAIVPKEEVEREDERPFGRRPVGTGPFSFVQWRDNDAIELKRHDDYFGGAPSLAGMRFRIIREPLVAYREYLSGHLEHCAVPEGYLEEVRSGPRAAELHSSPMLSTFYVGITCTREPAASRPALRRAMNFAINREFLCEKVLGGAHVPARGVLPPGLPGYNSDIESYGAQPDRARDELRAAGFGPENPVPEMTLYFRSGSPGTQVAQAVQSDLRRVGIPVQLRMLDMSALLEATAKGEPDLFRLAWVADFPDADNFLQLFHSHRFGASGNRTRYGNPRVDALLDQSRSEVNPARRLEIIRQIEQIVVTDAPWIFLSHGQTHLLVQPYVRNLAIGPMDAGSAVNQVDFAQVRIEE